MREIRYTTRFKHDYKREKSGRCRKIIDEALMVVVNLLAADRPLPSVNVDHPLLGEWADYRDCHIRPDFILIC
jgi:mRNA interferase YafQ